MKIYDEEGRQLDAPDLGKGWLETTQRVVAHHPAEPEIPEVTHIEVMEGTNGLRKLVVDKPAVPAKDAWDEYESVQIYRPYTPEELEQHDVVPSPGANYEQRLAALERAALNGGF